MMANRIILHAGVLFVVLVVSIMAYSSGQNNLLVAMVAFPPLVFLINNPGLTFCLSVALFASSVTLPGLPSRINLSFLMMIVCTITFIAANIVKHRKLFNQPQSRYILGFVILLAVHVYVRGFGLRSLGGESWGGFNYVTITAACLFYLATGHLALRERAWRRTLIALCSLSLIPTVAQAIYAYSGGAIHQLFYFVVPEFQVLEFMFQREAGSQLARLHTANITSQFFFILAFLISYQRKSRPLSIFLIILSLAFAGLAGNRITMVFNLIFAVSYIASDRRKDLGQIIFHPAIFLGFTSLLLLGLFASYLPPTFQRVISFLPFSNVSWEVKVAASTTVAWRLEVWAAALKQLPEYLFIGKGFAFSAQDIMTINARVLNMNDIEFVIASRNYHNGFIHTLLDLGVISTTIIVGFMLSVTRRHFKLMKKNWSSNGLKHMHRICFSALAASIMTYFFIAGGVTHLAGILFWTIILEGLTRSQHAANNVPPEEKSAAKNNLYHGALAGHRFNGMPHHIEGT